MMRVIFTARTMSAVSPRPIVSAPVAVGKSNLLSTSVEMLLLFFSFLIRV